MAGKHGFGATFGLHDGVAIVAAAEVLAVTPPSPTIETIDTTNHGSAGAMREFIAGLIDTGEGTVRVNYLAGSATDLNFSEAAVSREVRAWEMTVPGSAGAWKFSGNCVVTSYEKDEVVIDDKMTALLSFKVSGAITEAAAV
ncbi:hypothetical protein KNJ79_02050 [Sphingopyxis indica]|uniref:phage tail tube protein n=1 Tax=Sphingopyxis indica TaxID=436663 RepID=UPI00293925A3|nr:phage tail tube protein [Sphingopyxis indica]WOF43770.1 hypothetical protein KNJ79_02050 [Sphingopyxis indica]